MKFLKIFNWIGIANLFMSLRKYIGFVLLLAAVNLAIWYFCYEIEKYLLLTNQKEYLFYLLVGRISAHILSSTFIIIWGAGLLPAAWRHIMRLLITMIAAGFVYYIASQAAQYALLTNERNYLGVILIGKNIGYAIVLATYLFSYFIPHLLYPILQRIKLSIITTSTDAPDYETTPTSDTTQTEILPKRIWQKVKTKATNLRHRLKR